MDFHNRQYDPQLGRFMGIDPMADAAGQQGLSPYHAMACNPSTLTDPLGLYVKGEAHNGGGVPQYGNEMAMRFPTMPNFMARYVNFGERTASQSMAEQQQMAAEWAKKYYEEATTGGGNAQETAESEQGIDYIYNGTKITGVMMNGLDENRIVIYYKRKKGETNDVMRDMVNLGKKKLSKGVEEKKNSFFEFTNFGDGSILVWEFLAKYSSNEWSLTELKVGKNVYSRIYSKEDGMETGILIKNEFSKEYINDLVYWISVHSHPRGGGIGLSNNEGAYERSDYYTVDLIRGEEGYNYPNAQLNAYDIPNLYHARGFIEMNRK